VCVSTTQTKSRMYSIAVLPASYNHIADLIPFYNTANVSDFG